MSVTPGQSDLPLGKVLLQHALSPRLTEALQQFELNAFPPEKRSTAREYARQARMFLAWTEHQGWQPSDIPQDAVESYFQARGFDAKHTGRNLSRAGIRALLIWAPSYRLGIPDLSLPDTVAPPKRKKKEPPLSTIEETLPAAANLNGATPVFAAEPLAPAPVAAAPVTVAPVSVTQAEEAPAPPVTIAPPSANVFPMSKPRVTDKRVTTVRNPLGQLLPDGGTLRILRVSDGSDGAPPGKRVPVGDYQEPDLRGYNNIVPFIREVLHPSLPTLRAPTLTYIVEQWDNQGRLIPPVHQIPIPNMAAANGGVGAPGQATAGVTQSSVNASIEEHIRKFSTQVERIATAQSEAQKRYDDTLEKLKNGGDVNALTLQLLMERRPQVPDSKALMEEYLAKVKTTVQEVQPAMAPPAMAPSNLGQGENASGVIMDRLLDGLQEVNKALRAPPPVAQQAPPQDPLDLLMKARSILTPATPPVDPVVLELRAEIKEMRNKMDGGPKSPTLAGMLADMAALDGYMQRKMGGGGESSVAETLAAVMERMPETLQSIGGLIEKAKAGALAPPQIKQGTPGKGTPASGTAQPTSLQTPPAVAQALQALITADDDQGILNAVFGLIQSLAQSGPPWQKLVQEILGELQGRVDTIDELQSLVTKVFRLCQQRQLLIGNPGRASHIAIAIGRNFPLICSRIGVAPRSIAGVEVNYTEEASTAEAASGETVSNEEPEAEEEEETEEASTDEPEGDTGARTA